MANRLRGDAHHLGDFPVAEILDVRQDKGLPGPVGQRMTEWPAGEAPSAGNLARSEGTPPLLARPPAHSPLTTVATITFQIRRALFAATSKTDLARSTPIGILVIDGLLIREFAALGAESVRAPDAVWHDPPNVT